MQTKTQIQQLLAAAGVEPNKRLGQNFLIDMNLINLLLKSAHISRDDVVLEVGTGTGSLTQALAQQAGKVIAVEFDKNLAHITAEQLSSSDNVIIINTDALENKNTIDHKVIEALEATCNEFYGKLMLVANLPYSIASPVMMNLILGPVVVDSMVVTVQKEVADRMTAEPGHDNYGILSIFMAATGSAKTIRKLSPKVFWPQPQVDSTMIRFDRDNKKVARMYSIELFKEVVNLFMAHRRKMMKACVKFADGNLAKVHNWQDVFEHAVIEPHCRPEELTAENYIAMANLCHESIQ